MATTPSLTDPLALTAAIAGLTALAFWLEGRFRWAAKLGASLLIIAAGALLSNLGLVPAASPVYDAITGPVTSLAIAWLLLAVDLRDLRFAGPRMLAAFGIAVAGTVLGAVVATWTFGSHFGEEAWKLAGVMTGTYSGGSLNFVSVGRELALPDALFAAATAADNVVTALWMGATLLLPLWLGRQQGQAASLPPAPVPAANGEVPAHATLTPVQLRPLDLALLLAVGLVLLFAAQGIASRVPGVPGVLWLTTFALVAAQLPAVRRLRGTFQAGILALHLFFAVIGIGSRIADIVQVGPEVLYLTLTVVAVHGFVAYGVGRLVGLGVATSSVASQAAVGGPSTAMALAVARDWPGLALPGLMAGLLGYAVGNYAGFAVAYLMRGVLG